MFAVLVAGGAALVVKQGNGAAAVTTRQASVSAPQATVATSPAPQEADLVVLAGPDLARLQDLLAARTGWTVEAAAAAPPAVLAPQALSGLTRRPRAVVLEVLAGARTTARTATAVTVVRARWPGMKVLVVGPFSSADPRSTAAAKAAARAAGSVFLDPVALGWRASAASPALTADDLHAVADRLGVALA